MAALSAAAIAGITIAVVVTCVVLIALGYVLRIRRRRRSQTVVQSAETSGEIWSEISVAPRQIFELPSDLPIKDGLDDPGVAEGRWRAPVQEFPISFPDSNGYPEKLCELPAHEPVQYLTRTLSSAVNNAVVHSHSGGVNPRDVEYEPNPVIFPHLKDASRSYMAPWGADEKDRDVGLRSPGVVQMTFEANISSLDAEQSKEFALSASPQPPETQYNEQGPRALIAAILSGRSLSPLSQQSTVAEARPTAVPAIPSLPSLPESDSSTPVDAGSVALNVSTPATSLHSPAPPQLSSPSDTVQPNACSDCDSTFRTPGQLREHRNRKHVRRYICTICTRDFHLQADLKRHEKTVHRSAVQSNTSCIRCTNSDCKTPNKEWDATRMDNFHRHVNRCRKASARKGNGMTAVMATT